MKNQKKYSRIYVCHTYYHAYISCLKELALPVEEQGKAHIVLSSLSNNFETLGERLLKSGIFSEVFDFDEKRENFFPNLLKWKKNRGNILLNMPSRMIFTKKFAKALEPYVPVDFKEYEDIYVYCDLDPIGYYLSGHHIYYHAVEDGLDYLAPFVPAIYDNQGALKLKLFLSNKLNWIFIQDGFNKYCLDMEVNNISLIKYPNPKYKEIPRKPLVDRLTDADKEKLILSFVENLDKLNKQIESFDSSKDNVIILTEPLCDLTTRERIFRDLIDKYSKEGNVFLKPHPRDELDYPTVFADIPQFKASVPMELLNFFTNLHFKKVVSVFTHLESIQFADEKERLGYDFMDKYEDPAVHRKGDQIKQ